MCLLEYQKRNKFLEHYPHEVMEMNYHGNYKKFGDMVEGKLLAMDTCWLMQVFQTLDQQSNDRSKIIWGDINGVWGYFCQISNTFLMYEYFFSCKLNGWAIDTTSDWMSST